MSEMSSQGPQHSSRKWGLDTHKTPFPCRSCQEPWQQGGREASMPMSQTLKKGDYPEGPQREPQSGRVVLGGATE